MTNAAAQSNYTASPATALVATHCAVCGRPLCDAESVECGIGPDCRLKYGYVRPDGFASWPSVDAALEGTPALEVVRTEKCHPRLAANYLVWLVAVAPKAPESHRYVAALWQLGYRTLAAKIAIRIRGIVVREEAGELVVQNEFSHSLNDALRACHVPSQWDAVAKVRRIPLAAKGKLWEALRKAYAGRCRVVVGARGAVVL